MKRYMEDFNYYFDNNHGDVVIGQYTFSASEVLSVMDSTAYDNEFNYWLKTYSGVMHD
jgi:hypothetical protein